MSESRRKFLTFATGSIAGIGAALLSIPFVRSLNPPKHIEPPFIDIKITKLQPGQMTVAIFREKPIYVTRRTKQQIEALYQGSDRLLDPGSLESDQPDFAQSPLRSRREDIFVGVGLCTHLGCAPSQVSDNDTYLRDEVRGGYFCPCHGAEYDAAGRVFEGGPAPKNLAVPNYEFIDEDTIRVSQQN